jgi:hypothetical protein
MGKRIRKSKNQPRNNDNGHTNLSSLPNFILWNCEKLCVSIPTKFDTFIIHRESWKLKERKWGWNCFNLFHRLLKFKFTSSSPFFSFNILSYLMLLFFLSFSTSFTHLNLHIWCFNPGFQFLCFCICKEIY